MACEVVQIRGVGNLQWPTTSSFSGAFSVGKETMEGPRALCSPQKKVSSSNMRRRSSVEMWSNFSLGKLPSPVGTWRLQGIIGKGQFGVVYTARSADEEHITAAAKVVDVDESDSYAWSAARNEVCILKRSKHKNVVQLHGAYRKDSEEPWPVSSRCKLWVVMELCDGGSVKHLVSRAMSDHAPLSEEIIRYMLHETLQGLRYLHDNSVIHRDVKGSNILFTRNGDVKLVDFGVAAKILQTDQFQRRRSTVGTPHYMAPEVIFCEYQDDLDYDSRCDTWSVGITAIQMAEGKPPLYDMSNEDVRRHIPRQRAPSLSDEDMWSTAFQEFISSCLTKDMDKRPFCRDLLNHRFICHTGNTDNARDALADLINLYATSEVQQNSPSTSTPRYTYGSDQRLSHGRRYGVVTSPPLEVVKEESSPSSSPHMKREANEAIMF